MEITFTQVQLDALTRSNESSNPDVATRPKINDYIQAQCSAAAEQHVKTWQKRDEEDVRSVVAKGVLPMTPEDKATVVSILDKYQIPPPKEVVVDSGTVEEPLNP